MQLYWIQPTVRIVGCSESKHTLRQDHIFVTPAEIPAESTLTFTVAIVGGESGKPTERTGLDSLN
jgi:hypothetical protein